MDNLCQVYYYRWDCNRGKGGNPLAEVTTAEDPHDRAILLLEKQRQLKEYDAVLAGLLEARMDTAQELLNFWCDESMRDGVPRHQFQWLVNTLDSVPATAIKEAMMIAIGRRMTRDWRYVIVIIRNWREDGKLSATT